MASRSEVSRVLLTGARGFTGAYMRRELEQAGYSVVGTTMHAPATASEQLLDITDLADCRRVIEAIRPDYVVHLAAVSFVQHPDPVDFYRANVVGTSNLLSACAETGHLPKKILLASSGHVYGSVRDAVFEETHPLNPMNHYAISKVAMEYMARNWFDRLPIVIARPFNYTGVNQPPHFLVPKIVQHFRNHASLIELGNLDVARDFSDVRAVAAIYRTLLEEGEEGEIVNVCSGRARALREIIEILQRLAGYEIRVEVNPAFVRNNEVRSLVGSTKKLRRMVSIPELFSFEDTLRWMYEA